MKKNTSPGLCYPAGVKDYGRGYVSDQCQKISTVCGVCGEKFEALVSPEGQYLNASEVHGVILCSVCVREAFKGLLSGLERGAGEPLQDFLNNQSADCREERSLNDYVEECKDLCYRVSPKNIYSHLSEYIVGQEKAKRQISTALYNHIKRVNIKNLMRIANMDIELDKSNLLMLGPTGCGKSYMMKIATDFLDIPFVSVDATGLTEAGYIGENVESIIEELWKSSGQNKEMAEKGIVFIDEIDKLANNRDVGGVGVQRSLLKILEGTDITISPRNSRNKFCASYLINTSEIMFILGGAFGGINKVVKRNRNIRSSIGFVNENNQETVENLGVTPNDIVSYGLIPELVGRITNIVALHGLSSQEIKKILTDVRGSFLNQKKFMMKYEGIEMKITDKALDKITEEILDLGVGARGIKSVINNYLEELEFSSIGEKVDTIVLDINNNEEVVVIHTYLGGK